MTRGRIVVALGGNAIARAGGEGTWQESVQQMRQTAPALAEIVAGGAELLVTHGNGPQVGRLLRQNEIAQREVPARPLDVLVGETQAELGYLVQQELTPALVRARAPRTVLSFLSRVVVSAKDPAFRRPTKPVGQYYSEQEARVLRKSKSWAMVHDPARGGWRRVVPSPKPVRWVEGEAFGQMYDSVLARSIVPVVAGGGGIPVLDRGRGRLEGVEAVIDKDYTAALVARTVHADTLAILTDVPAVAIGYRKPWERWLGEVRPRELRGYLQRGEFGEGSMGPKVEAALHFLADGGRRALITDSGSLDRALAGESGTRILAG